MDKSKEASEAGRALAALGASKGGKARAESLTPEQRKEIAKKAAESRWGKDLPHVICGSDDLPMKIGDMEIPCYVLDDETRVITHRGMQRSLGMAESGGAQRLLAFLGALERKGIDCKDLKARIENPIKFMMPKGGMAHGYDVDH